MGQSGISGNEQFDSKPLFIRVLLSFTKHVHSIHHGKAYCKQNKF